MKISELDRIIERRGRGAIWFIEWTQRMWVKIYEEHLTLKTNERDMARGRHLVYQGSRIVKARKRLIEKKVLTQPVEPV